MWSVDEEDQEEQKIGHQGRKEILAQSHRGEDEKVTEWTLHGEKEQGRVSLPTPRRRIPTAAWNPAHASAPRTWTQETVMLMCHWMWMER